MTAYRLRPKAIEDLEAISDYIAADSPANAIAFVDALLDLCARIAENPRAYRRRDDLGEGIRQAVHGRYLILFTDRDRNVVIERVVHGARRLEELL